MMQQFRAFLLRNGDYDVGLALVELLKHGCAKPRRTRSMPRLHTRV